MIRWIGATIALFALTSLPLACGGSSRSNGDGANGSASGGSASGGSGGSGGASSTRGSGGSDSSGSNGSSASGGSGGSRSSGSGGARSSGSGGSASGGSGGSAGGSGGASSSGSAGEAGAPSNPVPSEEAVDACTAYCKKKDEAGCENEETLQACLDGCNVTTRILDCEDELLAALECSQTANVTCNDQGVAEFTGCGVVTLAWLSCVVTKGPDQDLLEPCQGYCAAVQQADCPNDTDSEEDCILGCTVIGTILPECKSDWQDLLACSDGQDLVCNDGGQAQAPSAACGAEQISAVACVLSASGGS